MQTHLLLLTQRKSRQEERENVCCEMPELCTHHNINTQESLCLKIAFQWLKQMSYIGMDCTHIMTSLLLFEKKIVPGLS